MYTITLLNLLNRTLYGFCLWKITMSTTTENINSASIPWEKPVSFDKPTSTYIYIYVYACRLPCAAFT